MTTSSVLLVLALACALFAVLLWGFRRAGDGPGVAPAPPERDHGHGQETDRR
jgi:hypothetical protein